MHPRAFVWLYFVWCSNISLCMRGMQISSWLERCDSIANLQSRNWELKVRKLDHWKMRSFSLSLLSTFIQFPINCQARALRTRNMTWIVDPERLNITFMTYSRRTRKKQKLKTHYLGPLPCSSPEPSDIINQENILNEVTFLIKRPIQAFAALHVF